MHVDTLMGSIMICFPCVQYALIISIFYYCSHTFDLHWSCFNDTALPIEHLLLPVFSCNSLKFFNLTIMNSFSGSFKSLLFYVNYWCCNFNPLLSIWSPMNPTALIDTQIQRSKNLFLSMERSKEENPSSLFRRLQMGAPGHYEAGAIEWDLESEATYSN